MPSAVKPWTSTAGMPWPHTATPTRCPSSSVSVCRARRGAVGVAIGASAGPSASGLVEDAPRLVTVSPDLVDQRLQRLEALLTPQPCHEAHLGGLAVQVAAEVEQVGFEQAHRGVVVELRAPAQAYGA